MIQRWVESTFIKRSALAFVAWLVAHGLVRLTPLLAHMETMGVFITIKINQDVFAQYLTGFLMAISQGLHEFLAAKYPEIGKYV